MKKQPGSDSDASTFRRIVLPRSGYPQEANIRRRYLGETVAWIWHPGRLNETAFLRFTLDFEIEEEETLTFQVSADQRFQLSVDGIEFAYGPDRSDVAHWSLQAYEGRLQPGRHMLSGLVWWIAENFYGVLCPVTDSGCSVPTPPLAQCSFRGGFLLAAPGVLGERVNTGTAAWKVEDLTHAVSMDKRTMVGSVFAVAAEKWGKPGPFTLPVIVRVPVNDNIWGEALPGWRLETSLLPEQQRRNFSGGKIREIRQGAESLEAWQNLVSEKSSLRIEPHRSSVVLWDLENYCCGYPLLRVSGGRDASIGIEWAESLYEAESPDKVGENTPKGQRNETAGKIFRGFGDRFVCSGTTAFTFPAFWWRSGRFVEIRVTTADEPLVIEQLSVKTTRYPLKCESSFEADDPALGEIARLAVNTMQAGTHELFVDSPYYEQMAYVGDNVTEALVSYVMTRDTRITRRAIELFDWSRAATGLVAERWPCAVYQGSATYAMLWPTLVRNHAWWRNEPDFIRERLRGVRHLVEELAQYRRPDGLLKRLPGWSFVDWVREWKGGYPPGHEEGDSSLVNLHWILCLQAAADLEYHFGESEFHQRLKRMEEETKRIFIERYRCPESGLYYDDSTRLHISEHANALASLAGLMDDEEGKDWPERLLPRNPARCSVYFTHYLLEAFARIGHAAPFFERLRLWRSFLDYGLCTIPEQPEPTRSDCHAWGAHPLYHYYAGIAGIRPASPGFQTVHIQPMLGPLRCVKGTLPHPGGELSFNLEKSRGRFKAAICLPANVTGTFRLGTEHRPLHEGPNTLILDVPDDGGKRRSCRNA